MYYKFNFNALLPCGRRGDEFTLAASCVIRQLNIGDYEKVIELWLSVEGVSLSEADSKENIATFLKRNAGSSFIAEKDGEIIGAILCGNDGRRGYLHHLAVHSSYRNNGLGRILVEACLNKLREYGIKRCHLFVLPENQNGMNFWNHIGFWQRLDMHVFSKDV